MLPTRFVIIVAHIQRNIGWDGECWVVCMGRWGWLGQFLPTIV